MWLETLTVRTSAGLELEKALPALIEQLCEVAPKLRVRAYSRSPIRSDITLHLLHGETPVSRSPHAIRLAEALRTYGPVDHSVWDAIDPEPPIPVNTSKEEIQ